MRTHCDLERSPTIHRNILTRHNGHTDPAAVVTASSQGYKGMVAQLYAVAARLAGGDILYPPSQRR